eukprot:TRINITY_DN992_c0_g1_i5.p1 TRINITY_DN992_c0_g1~~TRINITY_DN992_c0_g1_i5.p1  ORF type:complete len:149 (+),score=42.99 TRINITY_DN992_c0_g1_i5:27-449(+)
MIRRPPRSTLDRSSAASDVYKRQYQRRVHGNILMNKECVDPSLDEKEAIQLSAFLDTCIDYRIPEGSSEEFAELKIKIKKKPIIEAATKDRKAIEIVPGLYLGSIAAMIFSQELESAAITHILTVATGVRPFHVGSVGKI